MLARTVFMIPAVKLQETTAYSFRENYRRRDFFSMESFTILVKYKHVSLAQKPKALSLHVLEICPLLVYFHFSEHGIS